MSSADAEASSLSLPEEPAAPAPPNFSSVHTVSFVRLLSKLGLSLVISTYQAGMVILLRAKGDKLNTHFCQFPSPMGLAWDAESRRLALGTRHQIWIFANHPAVAGKLSSAEPHDAVLLPRLIQQTGDIRIHEIAWVGRELWAVNTRFSCLCTFDPEHNFSPRWKPDFISAILPEDRCHLNGLAVADNQILAVTCFARCDTPAGWREEKLQGGMIWDPVGQKPILQGLCMPHSPRWHEEKLWFLESGLGTLSYVDFVRGEKVIVASLPGFTRGLTFIGRYAVIGLSQVRESAIFGGVPIAEEGKERCCGVWVVDTATGQTVAFLRFEGAVQEIFAIELLPGIQNPELIHESGDILDSSFVIP